MKIALRNAGNNYWLAGEPGVSQSVHSSAGGVVFNGDVVIDARALVRAAVMVFHDRGNLRQDVSFGTVRKFATTGEAESWAALHDGVSPRTGHLDFYDEAGEPITRILNAVVKPPSRTVTGLSVELRYEAMGGRVLQPDGEGDYGEPDVPWETVSTLWENLG